MEKTIYQEVPDSLLPGEVIIVTNGQSKACPFTPPIMTPPKFTGGPPGMMLRGCGTWCALLEKTSQSITVTRYVRRCCGVTLDVVAAKNAEGDTGNGLSVVPK